MALVAGGDETVLYSYLSSLTHHFNFTVTNDHLNNLNHFFCGQRINDLFHLVLTSYTNYLLTQKHVSLLEYMLLMHQDPFRVIHGSLSKKKKDY